MTGPTNVETTPMCWICAAYMQGDFRATSKKIGTATAKARAFEKSICAHCNNVGTQPYDEAWRVLSRYLHERWREIIGRGSFDLSKVFAAEAATQAVNVHLYFVKALGGKLKDDGIKVDLTSFSAAISGCVPIRRSLC